MFLDAFLPSVMPRATVHQGLAAGINVLSGRVASGLFELSTAVVLPAGAALPTRIFARGVGVAAGLALEGVPINRTGSQPDTGKDAARVAGTYIRLAAICGALYDVATASKKRLSGHRPVDPIVLSGLATLGVAYWTPKRLARRKEAIERWPIPQYSTLVGSIGVSVAVHGAASLSAGGYALSRNALIRYLGPGWSKGVLARAGNVGIWALASSTDSPDAAVDARLASEAVPREWSVVPA
jgi:hypothetical protein